MTYLAVDLNSIASVAHYTDNQYQFFNMINKALEITGINEVVFATDAPGQYWRHALYPEYKAKRKHDPSRTNFVNLITDILKQSGYPVLTIPSMEADDIIASLPTPNWIFTKDRDLWQLYPKSNILTQDYMVVDEALCLAKFGVKPAFLPEFKALRGDPGDNLPGIKGIGDKTAAKLINEFGSIGAIYSHINQLPKPLQQKLKSGNPTKWLKLVKLTTPQTQSLTVQPKLITDKFQAAVELLRNATS